MPGPVIDIISSPEPEDVPMRGGVKAVQPIIIPDSDDDEDVLIQPPPRPRKRPRHLARTGKRPRPLRHTHAQESSDNIAGPSDKGKGRATTPLFLPGEEENEPPSSPQRAPITTPLRATPTPPSTPPPTLDQPRPATPDPQEVMFAQVAQVLEIIPDVEPAHVHELVERHYAQYQGQTLEAVLHILFEDKSYPKVDRKGKRKRTDADDEAERRGSKKAKGVDYASIARDVPTGPYYYDLAMEHLQQDFPYVPKPHIRSWFNRCHFLYAPAYLALAEEAKQPNPLYTRKSNPYRQGKGKTPERFDADFEQERAFILRIRREEQQKRDAELAEELIEKQAEESGEVIECGCCFTSYPFFKMIQCPDAHLFCKDCMLSYAETKLGSHDVKISCMDQSGCKELFPESELRRFLPEKLMSLYDRVKQRKEIEQAGLDGLEECPFCDYKVVIDNPDEKLFRCGNVEDCGAVSCRNCKKLDHLPKTCQEMEEDKKLDSQHLVEEAMSKALVRNCPNAQCGKPFIKDDGCNKIVCTNCRTLSCYICRKVIAGYDHFNQAAPGTASTSKKCPLWDGPVERRHAEEVGEAAKRALEEYKKNNPDARPEDIKVDVPKAPPVQPPIFPAPRGHAAYLAGHQLPGMAGLGPQQPGLGLQQPGLGLQQPGLGLPQPGMHLAGLGLPPPAPMQPQPMWGEAGMLGFMLDGPAYPAPGGAGPAARARADALARQARADALAQRARADAIAQQARDQAMARQVQNRHQALARQQLAQARQQAAEARELAAQIRQQAAVEALRDRAFGVGVAAQAGHKRRRR